MVNFDASPQLALVKKWLDAYFSLDVKNVEQYISRNFHYQAFPETTDTSIPEEAKEEHIDKYREILAAGSKFEVGIQALENRLQTHRLMTPPPLGHLPRSDRSTGESCHPRLSLYTEPSHRLKQ